MIFFLKIDGDTYPASAQDEKILKKIPPGSLVKCEYIKNRKYQNHRRYFAFIKILFESQEKFKDKTVFRKYLEVRAGYGIPVTVGEVAMIMPDSICYERLDETEFRKVFSRVIDAALQEFPNWTREDMLRIIEQEIVNFM